MSLPVAWNEDDFEKAIAQVTRIASEDQEYRELALTDSRAALEEVTAMKLPVDFVLRFVDNAGANLTIVLPDLLPESELSVESLDLITGGVSMAAVDDNARERERIRERIRIRIRGAVAEGVDL